MAGPRPRAADSGVPENSIFHLTDSQEMLMVRSRELSLRTTGPVHLQASFRIQW